MGKQTDLKKAINRVFSLEISKGHLKWKVSDLARYSGISRPLIYYHFGHTKQEILDHCLKTFAYKFYGLDSLSNSKPLQLVVERKKFFEGLVTARNTLSKLPSLTLFYLSSRSSASLSSKFLEIEKLYQQKLSRLFPELTKDQIITLHSLLHGALCAPFSTVNSTKLTIDEIRKWAESAK